MDEPASPIQATDSGTSTTVTFPDAGTYGLYCASHHESGTVFVTE